jgi:Membrane bound O-acyl transferase family
MFSVSLRSIEWTFAKKPLRRYEPRKREQDPLTERRSMSAGRVLLDAFDLVTNMRGIGWSWSSNPFPHTSTPPPSIAFALFNTVLLLTILDVAHYILQCVIPAVNNSRGGSTFDPSLAIVPRTALAAFCGIVAGVWNCATMDASYHLAMLVGRIIFRQPASAWPPLFDRPWMSTSIQEFWNSRWHQLWRRNFIVFGARPGGALFGREGAVMGAFALSAVLHHIVLWSVGNGTEFVTAGGFFLLMGVGVIMEGAFTKATGSKVRGWLGWSWMMIWTTLWGTLMIDGWARHGLVATDYFPNGPRPGKPIVDALLGMLRSHQLA